MKRRSAFRFVGEGIEGFAVLGGVLCTWPLSRRWLQDWGSSRAERERSWPGDRYVPAHHTTYTRAIDIGAPAAAVWPWVVQFGLDRAGFYSYELLERLIGIPVKNVESIEPTLQTIAVGDEVRLHPKAPGIPVAYVEPGRCVCFGEERDPESGDPPSVPGRSWSIYIESVSESSSRLVLRGCIEILGDASRSERLAAVLEQPIDFIMEQRMLRTIKRLAETGDDSD